MPVSNKLKNLRHEFKMNQTEFAEYLGISIYQYNRYEKGSRQPTLEVALQISNKVNRTVNDIFYIIDRERLNLFEDFENVQAYCYKNLLSWLDAFKYKDKSLSSILSV